MNSFSEYIKDSKNVLIICSRPIDFDCLGSGLLLKEYLKQQGKKVRIAYPLDLTPADLNFFGDLPCFEDIQIGDTRKELASQAYDLLILVDGMNWGQFFDTSRTDNPPDLNFFAKRVHIDHHSTNEEQLGTLTYYHPEYSSTTEIVLKEIIPAKALTPEMATLGYAGIVGDTGNFKWNFYPQTMRIVAQLLEAGADTNFILDKLYFQNSKAYLEALKFVIEQIVYDDNLGANFLFLSQEVIKKHKLSEEKLSLVKLAFDDHIAKTIPEYPRGFVLTEKELGSVTISGRGHNIRNKINLAELFAKLGGTSGGHFNAAGARVVGDFEQIRQKLISLLS